MGGGDRLDAAMEPIAQAIIVLLVLLAIASVSFFIINKAAVRRRERAHDKLSGSRRAKDTWVDLSGGAIGSETKRTGSSKHPKRRRSSSDHEMLDILAKPAKPEGEVAPGEGPAGQ